MRGNEYFIMYVVLLLGIIYFRIIFVHLEDQYYANFDAVENLIVLHHLFLPRINDSLKEFQDMWNNHKLRTENSRTPKQLEIIRNDTRAEPPTGEELCEEGEGGDMADEDIEEVAQVKINSLCSILNTEQQIVFDANVPSIPLSVIDLDEMGDRFNAAIEWMEFCKAL